MNQLPRPALDHAWSYCLSQWSQPGLADALLRRQDEEGLDVLLHLFARYAQEALGLAWDEAMQASAEASVKPWREGAVLPLRAMRRAVKAKGCSPGSPGADLLEHLRQAEVLAEKVELEQLCAWLTQRSSQA